MKKHNFILPKNEATVKLYTDVSKNLSGIEPDRFYPRTSLWFTLPDIRKSTLHTFSNITQFFIYPGLQAKAKNSKSYSHRWMQPCPDQPGLTNVPRSPAMQGEEYRGKPETADEL